jgi:hypothetical protein
MAKVHTWTPRTPTGYMNDELDQLGPYTSEAGAPDNQIYVDSSGRLGIGTTSPSSAIHLKDSIPDLTLEDVPAADIYVLGNNNGTFRVRNTTDARTDFQISGTGSITFASGITVSSGQVSVTADPTADNHLARKKYVDDEIVANRESLVFIPSQSIEPNTGSPASSVENSRTFVWVVNPVGTTSYVANFYLPPALRGKTLKMAVVISFPTVGSGNIRTQAFMKTYEHPDTIGTTGEMGVSQSLAYVNNTTHDTHEFTGSFTSSVNDRWGYVTFVRLALDALDTYAFACRLYGIYVYESGAGP